jgi:predicted lipoprotein with Yx(FWY)xxD motif
MRKAFTRSLLALSAVTLMTIGAHAAELVVAKNGMTLYTFDKDAGGVSACYDDCAKKWPPYVGTADEKLTEGWTLAKRKDDTMQWAYDGKPVYFFAKDKAKGDATGDGLGDVWHVIKE